MAVIARILRASALGCRHRIPPNACLMRLPVLIAALLMPAVAWFSQQGVFGPDNGAISDRYPTLLVAAGYAFAIWGPIFLGDLVFACWQLRGRYRDADGLRRLRPAAAA